MGLPVANGDLVVLRNCLTGQLLCLEPKVKQTEFGAEHAVTARTALDAIRRKALELVKQVRTSDTCGDTPSAKQPHKH